MAITNTQITDLIASYTERELGQLIAKFARDRSKLMKSGLAVSSNEVDKLRTGNVTGSITHINPLALTNYNVGSQDITQMGDVGKLSATTYVAQRHILNAAVGSADLVKMSTGFNDELTIEELFAEQQAGIDQAIAVASLKGVIAVAGAGVKYTLASGSEGYNAGVIKATASAEEFATQFNVAFVSSTVLAALRTASLVGNSGNNFVYARESGDGYDYWNGIRLIPTQAFGADMVLARAGLFAYASGEDVDADKGFEVERVANGGRGQGGTIYHNRWSSVLHPQGFSFKGTAGIATPETHLATAGAWTKIASDAEIAFRVISPFAG